MKTKTASLINRFLIPVLAVSGLTLGFVPREFSLESLISGQAGGQRIAGEETESAETQVLSVPELAVAKSESSLGEEYSLAELFRINGEYVRKGDLIVWKSGDFRLADGIVRQENVKQHDLSTYALGTDAVTSRIIRDHSIRSADLRVESVTSEAIDNGSVSSDDLAERISVRYLSVGSTLSFGRISSGVWNGSVIDSDYLDFSGIAGTDISIFTNDTGYITASTSDALTNKSGLVSMWTNDAGYITAASFAGTAGYVAKFSGSGTAVNSLIFESGSMIGIGTSNPANPLDIGIGGGIRLAAGVPGTTDMALYNDSGTLIWNGMALGTSSASVSGTAGYIGKFTGVNSIANSAIYETGGSVGIGTTSPGAKLEVSGGVIASAFNGNAIATGTGMLSLGSYSLYVTGNAYVNQNLRTIDAPTFAGLTLSSALAAANGGTGLSSYDEGDVLYYSSGSTLSRLAAGTDGQVLVMNGGIPAWQDTATGASHDLLSASHDDTTAATVQRGDIVTGQGSSAATWSRLAAGGVGQLLSIDSNGDVYWKSVSVGDGIGVTPDSLDFSELKDTMTLDADFNVWSSTNNYSINFDSGTLFLDTANDRVGIGTTAPGAKLDVAGTGRFTGQLASAVTTGTAPFSIASTTLVANLNVQYLNGKAGSYYAAASSISGTNGYLARFTADGAVGNSSMYTDGTRVGIGTTGYLNGALHIESSGSNGIYIRKAAGALYKGLYIMDDSGSSEGIEYAANVEMFNITGSLSDYRAGLRIHVDPGNTTPTANRLFGMVIGAHAPNAQGIYILADGASSSVMSSYAAGSYGTQMITGNGNGTSSTVSEFILHRSTGTMLDLYHSSSVMAGNAISVNVEADGTGSFQGNYLVLSKEYVPKLYIDKDANVVTSGVVNPAGGVVLGNSVPLLMGAGSPSALYYDGTNTVLNLRISGSGNLLLPSGNVGIGTTAPEYSLDVAGSIRASGQLISSVATGTAPFSIASTTLVSNLNAQYLNGQLGSYYAAASSVSGTSGYLAKFTGSGTVGNSPVYVSGTSVGIGTTAPEYSLDVAGTGRFTGLLTGQAGLTVTGGAVNLNASSNYAVNVATGTSTGAVTIGGGSNAVSIDSSDWDISTAGVMTGISGISSNGSYTQTGTSANAFTGISTFSNATYSALFTGGNVGIGTTAPGYPLDIQSATKMNSKTGYLTNGADYAEYFYTKDTDLVSGEAVCVDPTKDNAVKRCERSGDNNVMGIVSTNPSIVGNGNGKERDEDAHYKIIGMLGQVPAKVTEDSEGGKIEIGDSLTASETPGYLRKAKAGESTVGIAMEDLSGSKGTIQVLISRRNQSLTVEKVEEEVEANIASMDIQDQVDRMLATANDNLAVLESLTSSNAADIESLAGRLSIAESAIIDQKASLKLLESDIETIKDQNQAVIDFAAALNVESLIYKDVDGNLDLMKGELEAAGVVAGAYTVKTVDEDSATIGEAFICPEGKKYDKDEGDCVSVDGDDYDGKNVTVKTGAVTKTCKIFTSFESDPGGSSWIDKNTSEGNFQIRLSNPVTEKTKVDWWIVEASE